MSYIVLNPKQYLGQSVGNGQCVIYPQKAAHMLLTAFWKRGALVKGNKEIQAGTVIATFDSDGKYGNHTDGRSHVAVYLSQDAHGIVVLDQWVWHKIDAGGKPIAIRQPVHQRPIYFRYAIRPENDGGSYYVVQ